MKRSIWAGFIVILFLGCFLRFYGLEGAEPGADAIASIETARKSNPVEVIRDTRSSHQGASPLDFLLLHAWIKLVGETNLTTQIPAAIWGTIALVFIFLAGKKIAKPSTSLWAMFLLAISPFHIYFSREARYYSLFCLTSAALLWAIVRYRDRVSWKNTILLLATAVIGLYTHIFTLFILISAGVWFFVLRISSPPSPDERFSSRGRFLSFFLCSAAALLLFSPWLYYRMSGEYSQALRPFGWKALVVAWHTFASLSGTRFITGDTSWFPLLSGLVFFTAGTFIMIGKREKGILVLPVILISLTLVYITCFRYGYYPTIRQGLFLLPWFLLVEARGIGWFLEKIASRGKSPGLVIAANVLAALAISIGPFFQLEAYNQEASSVESLVEASQKGIRTGDLLVGIGMEADNAALHLNYANRGMGIVAGVLTPDEWLASVDLEKEIELVRVVFVSTKPIPSGSDESIYIVPYHYYIPAKKSLVISDAIRRFINLQGRALKRAEQEGFSPRATPSESLRLLAMAHILVDERKEAEEILERAIRLNPGRSGPHAALADLLEKTGRLSEAEDNWRAAIRGSPPRGEHLVRLGRLLLERGRSSEARESLERALERDPDHKWALLYLRHSLLNRGNTIEAETVKTRIEQFPDLPPEITWSLEVQDSHPALETYLETLEPPGLFLVTVGFLDRDSRLKEAMIRPEGKKLMARLDAIRDLPHFVKKGVPMKEKMRVLFVGVEPPPPNAPFRDKKCGVLRVYNPGRVYADYRDIVRDGLRLQVAIQEHCLEQAPPLRQAWSYVMLANLSQVLPEHARETVACLKRAVDLAPGHPIFSMHLAGVLLSAGKREEAQETIDEALERHPSNRELEKLRSRILEKP